MNRTPQGNRYKVWRLQNLGVSYGERYKKLGDVKDLEAGLQCDKASIELTAEDDPHRAQRLHNLAFSYKERYERLGELEDLEAALRYNQEAVDHTPEGDPERAGRLLNLGVSYSLRYQRLGDLKDLDGALQYFEASIALTPEKHPDQVLCLQNLAVSYTQRYQRLDDLKDLEAALQYHSTTLDLTPEDHPNKAERLWNLSISYNYQYQRLGDLKDLQKTLHYRQTAVGLTPTGHPDRAQYLMGLGGSYSHRYQMLGDLKDAEMCFLYVQTAMELMPEDHPKRLQCLQGLSVSHTHLYQRLGDLNDLEAALQYDLAAVNLTPEDHADKARNLYNLALSYTHRYERLENLEDLEAALRYGQAAINLIPQDHPDKSQHLQNIAVCHTSRYQRLGDPRDHEAALHYGQIALKIVPEDHPYRGLYLQNLALAYIDQYKIFKEPSVLKLIHSYFEDSLGLMTSATDISWQHLMKWVSFATEFCPEDAVTAFRGAFHLLPQIVWIGHSITTRHDAVRRLDIAQLTSTATRTCISLADFESAVEIMEQGVGTIYQQMLQLKTPVDELPFDSEQAQALQQLSVKLYTQGSDPSMNLVIQRNDLIKQIRKQPGFELFLRPKPYDVLCKAAQGGPIVILNSHKDGCDAIIILDPTSDPVHVAFPNVTVNLLVSHRVMLDKLLGHKARGSSASTRLFGYPEGFLSATEQYKNMLLWLWNNIVDPVYQALKLVSNIHNVSKHRLWWLPTGAFAGLPLHACPPEDQSDRFIHSYTATLGSLLEAYAKKPKGNSYKLGVVGVMQTDSRGTNYLKGVEQEVDTISYAVGSLNVNCLKGKQATVDAVKKQLQTCSWLHLACHGKQDLIKPTKSHLLLYGGNLELGTILQMPLSNAEVVFLAACQTAMGDSKLVNESFHLGGGFIAAGFQGAIGTLWSMADEDGPLVAKLFYSHLFRSDHHPQASEAAKALDNAIKELKKTVSYERWIPFIHIGI
ncbi:CHAT domain-containing protein [Mycena pura]|uniref:CHAT domain-containing protein n=1 Tax=Mycena pura TaxID=153505 RepID=A0AAD6V5B3_9AGAR|nr:CHAT domain-containing protein [Mycena pura]